MLKAGSYISCLLMWLALTTPANGERIYVHASAEGDNNGTSWDDAYTSLSDAMDPEKASAGDEVWVAAAPEPYSAIMLIDGVNLYGGFSGNETTASQSNPDTYVTIISGSGTGRAMLGTNLGSSTVVRGFHIIDGSNPGAYDPGAGVLLTDSSPTFVQCVFRDSVFTYMGGAVANIGNGSPRFVNCKFYHNERYVHPVTLDESGYAGGAVYNRDGSPTFVNCLFYENTAMEAGGIASVGGVVTLINCTFADNIATTGNGGAIYDYDGKAVVRNCIFWNNTAEKSASNEIFNSSGSTTVTYSNVKGGWTGTGNIDSNPKFINPGSDNYKIGGTFMNPSPCKDAGDDSDVRADWGDLDWDGNTTEQTPLDLSLDLNRFSWNGVDMGAYEWTLSQQ